MSRALHLVSPLPTGEQIAAKMIEGGRRYPSLIGLDFCDRHPKNKLPARVVIQRWCAPWRVDWGHLAIKLAITAVGSACLYGVWKVLRAFTHAVMWLCGEA